MLEESNLVTNYFDSSSFKEATNYIKNGENIPLYQSMNNYATNQKTDRDNISNQIRNYMDNLWKC